MYNDYDKYHYVIDKTILKVNAVDICKQGRIQRKNALIEFCRIYTRHGHGVKVENVFSGKIY